MQHSLTRSPFRPVPALRLSDAARVDISLRNFLYLSVLDTPHASAFHLGSIVRITFVLAYLKRLGYSTLSAKELRRAEQDFGRATTRFEGNGGWRFKRDELDSLRRIVKAFDVSLEGVPIDVLAQAHRFAQANLSAPANRRMSISTITDDGNAVPR